MRHLISGLLLATSLTASADDIIQRIQPLFAEHCYRCHGAKKKKAGIDLRSIDSLENAFRHHKLLAHALEQIQSDEMPPDDEDVLPSKQEKETLVAALSDITKRIKTGNVPQKAGRVTLHRLNRNEYNYSVRDLFGVNLNATKTFPTDGSGGEGFDNTADALFLSPSLMEKYLIAARQVIAAVYSSSKLKNRALFERPKSKTEAKAVAQKILRRHASLAYRKEITEQELAPLLSAYDAGRKKGLSFERALRTPLTAILVNPRFLFRSERDFPDQKEWPLNDFEIASRLSYFLWSSLPDRQLHELARQGKLKDPKVLEAQTRRMLKDWRSVALARHFGGQWIGFEKMLEGIEPDKKRFPDFTRHLRRDMYDEGVAFFNHLIRENRPITEIIDSDYIFVNEALAKHYGLKTPIKGRKLKKISRSDKTRGGVMGMGGVLTTTSLPLRTSPVLRGVWILDSLLGDPAPPPPPDAGELPADDTKAKGKTFREQLAQHRESVSCANCHAKIDPLGFSLENYDAIGAWRDKDGNGKKIDSTASLPGGITFSTPSQLKQYILSRKPEFSRNISRKMLSYALGRGLEYYDEAIITQLVTQLEKNNDNTHSLILAIVQSHPFLNRSATR